MVGKCFVSCFIFSKIPNISQMLIILSLPMLYNTIINVILISYCRPKTSEHCAMTKRKSSICNRLPKYTSSRPASLKLPTTFVASVWMHKTVDSVPSDVLSNIHADMVTASPHDPAFRKLFSCIRRLAAWQFSGASPELTTSIFTVIFDRNEHHSQRHENPTSPTFSVL
jgi:hypothetical protein